MNYESDMLQEGKIDGDYYVWELTARENHIFGLRCPECGFGVLATKGMVCPKDGALMDIEDHYHVGEAFGRGGYD